MFKRALRLPRNHSFFLFGPRGSGKTTLLLSELPKDSTVVVDLLDLDTELRLSSQPKAFSEFLNGLGKQITWVVVDEIQKAPFLLDEVHRHIEKNPHRHFAITGSSARKLKRGKANLLAGRAFSYQLFPLTISELGMPCNLQDALEYGTLPKQFALQTEEEKRDFLRSYANTYLKEEIKSEALVRNLVGFQRFLLVAGKDNGQSLSFSNLARECGLDARTIQSYFEILEDTLMGVFLPAYRRSIRKRQGTHPKFYLFDTGVKRALAGELNIPLVPGTSEYGKAFEHFFVMELMRMNAYHKRDWVFSYFSTSDIEIDLVIERPGKPLLFVEIKSSDRVKDSELRPLLSLVRDVKDSEGICICREPAQRKIGNVMVSPWELALQALDSL